MAAEKTASTSAVRYAPQDLTLPKPWRGLIDGKTGNLYFWNPETNTTQYERPGGSSHPGSTEIEKSSSISLRSSDHVSQQPSDGQCIENTPNDDDVRQGQCNSKSSMPASEMNVQSTRTESEDPSNVLLSSSGNGGPAAKANGSSGTGNDLSAEAYRSQHEITIDGDDNAPAPFTSFRATGFPMELLKEFQSAGFGAPTPIQAQSWPIALQNRDIVAIAKTGSGKTLGYLIPGFIHLKRRHNNSQNGPTVLVLSPTRELATQIQDEAVKFGKSARISCTCLYGGAPKGPQIRELCQGADIVVATPGRLNDILEMRKVSLQQVSYLVLDEADRMLDMGFEPQIRKIVKEVPVKRQTLMYTATWPKEVRKIASDLLVNPIQVNIGKVDELVANKSISQHIEVMSPMEKSRRLEQILRSQEPGSKIIIFCSTKKMCDQLASNLRNQFGSAAIHGDKSQDERDHVLNQFRNGRSPVLVATDVAARGLDVKDIRVVVNYDFPTGIEDYVHRIGRTGRAGATGAAYTFFGDRDAKHAFDLIKILEGANQSVPSELRALSGGGGGGGFRPKRQWSSSGSGGQDGGGGGGYGRKNDSDGGGGGRGSYHDYNSQGRGGGGGGGWNGNSNSGSGFGGDRERSRSPAKDMRGSAGENSSSSGLSFHERMMKMRDC
ncbi:DEAD-box ATP-dependent RNA helicase 46-like [Impatiens glandulifera]|uniref:DEAD-box ATP-dependent RNA helicase 46-like n=1 Tax=Impatiens glandulifera TaxID=253017 RepID=UPI001FB14244|nr:DEAD-box ATP-dependent RNA helicase 46-like [Impatiens glandulifera]